MGLIPRTGRKALNVRLLHTTIYAALTLGAASMLAPFLLMLSGATRTGVDQHEFSILPRFLLDDQALFRKHIEALYNESPAALRAAWGVDHPDFSSLSLLPDTDPHLVQSWRQHADHAHSLLPGYSAAPVSRSRPLNIRRFKHHLKNSLSPDIHTVNDSLHTDFADWNAFHLIPPDPRSRLGIVDPSPWWQAWHHFTQHHAQPWTLSTLNLSGYFHERVRVPRHGRDTPRIPLPPTLPDDPDLADDWRLFVRETLHPRHVRIDPHPAAPAWRQFLLARHVDLPTLRRVTGLDIQHPDELLPPESWEDAGPLRPDWEAFLQGWNSPDGQTLRAPAHTLRLHSPDLAWRHSHQSSPPLRQADQLLFETHKSDIRRTLLLQQFATVWEILVLDGRGLGNTAFYCAMAVLLALIVNPLAAYALSRFRPPKTYALLLFLLLTMAFPPMVTQIPVFLMLRDFGLLNTFWALLLPGMAHGYSIFLLKGFFDSLPRDLYESAALDGAGEIRMFLTITLSLSKPILAVIALSAFVSAYTNFMFALLICQDERMWTLMVWLYQLQQRHGPGVMNAAFVIAALPTLLVFLLAQNQIIRGIVIPVEK